MTELLMPAGDFEKMQYALAFGADAVYLGIPQYSLRARENGFNKRERVVEAIEYAHRLNKKVYVTANILPHNQKIKPFIKYVDEFLVQAKPDAWIMSDPGLIMLLKDKYPDQEIHLSVQANTVNYASAKFWEKMGASRIILSRELSINEIKAIRDACPNLELEAFVHGSICIAYSGRCLISNYMSYRDPNQGTCTNSCRWEYKIHEKKDEAPYKPVEGDYYLEESDRPGRFMQLDEDENGTYLMNARDLCAIEYLKEMHEAGIDSFKVEGRSKSIYYAATIARVYRWAIDDMLVGKPFNKELLKEVFATASRGLTTGFLKGVPDHSAQSYDEGASKNTNYRFSGIVKEYDAEKKMISIQPRNPIKRGMCFELFNATDNMPIKVTEIFNQNFDTVEAAYGGTENFWISCPKDPGGFALLREPINIQPGLESVKK